MLNSNHPDDERLSALASHDTDATADASLTAHVSACARCTQLVHELGSLRASLAELPDLRPSRPLRLLPEIAAEPERVDRLGGWARRFFAPILATGAAVAMVGLIGTAAPALDQMASAPGGAQSGEMAAPAGSGAAAFDATTQDGAETAAPRAAEGQPTTAAEGDGSGEGGAQAETFLESSEGTEASSDPRERTMAEADEDHGRDVAVEELTAERSPWPMVLFTGVALMVAAALLRWILAPRAG